jgi:hypothetical protein
LPTELVKLFPNEAAVRIHAIQMHWQLDLPEVGEQVASEAVARFDVDQAIANLWAEVAVRMKNHNRGGTDRAVTCPDNPRDDMPPRNGPKLTPSFRG